jgi:hypothetical protein
MPERRTNRGVAKSAIDEPGAIGGRNGCLNDGLEIAPKIVERLD